MELYSIGDFAKKINKTVQTLRNWDKTNKLKPYFISPSGHRYYSQEQLNHLLGLQYPKDKKKIVIGYCRVSSHKQKDDLERQVNNMKQYLIAKGKPFEIITDIGSGINYDKKGLNELMDKVLNYEVESVVILYKDRLLRFGYELLNNLFEKHGTSIEIVDNTPKTDEQELVEDLIQIMTVFSCKLNGKRSNKTKKMIEELENNENDKSKA